jgi:hypothetical protein
MFTRFLLLNPQKERLLGRRIMDGKTVLTCVFERLAVITS